MFLSLLLLAVAPSIADSTPPPDVAASPLPPPRSAAVHGPAGTATVRGPSDTVVVKGIRRERPLREIAQKTETVTRQDIESTPATNLADLLKKTSDVDVIQYTGLLSGIGMRGFRPQYSGINQRSLLLVDGLPAGATNLSSIGIFDIERIEVLKGPSSALFGPLAMGGVVNIVTAKTVTSPYAEIALGSFGRTEASFGLGRRDTASGFFWNVGGRVMDQAEDYRIGRSHLLHDAFGMDDNVPKSSTGAALTDTGDGYTFPHTRYQEAQGSLALGWSSGPWYLRARTTMYDAPNVQTTGDLGGTTSWATKNLERYAGDLVARGQFGSHAVTLQGYRSREYSENWKADAVSHYYEGTNDWMGLQGRDNLSLGPVSLTTGLDWGTREAYTERWASANQQIAPYGPDFAIHDFAGYAEVSAKLLDGALVPTAGVRFDEIGFQTKSTDGLPSYEPRTRWFDVFSPSAGMVGFLPFGLRAHVAGGKGFVTPDAIQVAGYAVTVPNVAKPRQLAVVYGNPDLDPESNWSIDGGVGIDRPEAGLSFDVTAFGNFVQDKIQTQIARGANLGMVGNDTVVQVTRYANADDATYEGVEISGSWDAGKLLGWKWGARLFGNSTIYATKDETTKGVKTEALNVGDDWTAGIEMVTPDQASVRVSSHYIGRRLDYYNVDCPAFLVTDLVFLVPVGRSTRLSVSVNNLTDENYYETRGYNQPGRNWRLSMRHEF